MTEHDLSAGDHELLEDTLCIALGQPHRGTCHRLTDALTPVVADMLAAARQEVRDEAVAPVLAMAEKLAGHAERSAAENPPHRPRLLWSVAAQRIREAVGDDGALARIRAETRAEGFPTGADLIAAERHRQVESEGWTPDHDREYGVGTLALAATAYETGNAGWWPWDRQWWKPKGALRNLVRAGALFQAAADVADSDAYHSPSFYRQQRDRVAGEIDALLTEVRAALADADTTAHDPEGIESLIERSSLGTPAAKAARESVSDEDAARVVARARELDAETHDRAVAAQALRDAADIIVLREDHVGCTSCRINAESEAEVWLRERAAAVRQGGERSG